MAHLLEQQANIACASVWRKSSTPAWKKIWIRFAPCDLQMHHFSSTLHHMWDYHVYLQHYGLQNVDDGRCGSTHLGRIIREGFAKIRIKLEGKKSMLCFILKNGVAFQVVILYSCYSIQSNYFRRSACVCVCLSVSICSCIYSWHFDEELGEMVTTGHSLACCYKIAHNLNIFFLNISKTCQNVKR